MEQAIHPFAFGDSLVRTHIDETGGIWFVARDVCNVLDIGNPSQAIRSLDEDERFTLTNDEGKPRVGIPREMALISESGMYSLVFRSRKPAARAFSKWVRSEVLPSLRRTGRYEMPTASAAPIPDCLPEEALSLRPALRLQLWQNALQTARLDGANSAAAREWFIRLCDMMKGRRGRGAGASSAARQKADIAAYVEERLEPTGEECVTGIQEIWDDFCLWWKDSSDAPRPRRGVLEDAVFDRFPRKWRAAGWFLYACRVRDAV